MKSFPFQRQQMALFVLNCYSGGYAALAVSYFITNIPDVLAKRVLAGRGVAGLPGSSNNHRRRVFGVVFQLVLSRIMELYNLTGPSSTIVQKHR